MDDAQKECNKFKEQAIEVRKKHQDMCTFFMIEKTDDMYEKSEDFFKIFQGFFKQMQQNLPKEEKKKKAGGMGMNADMLAELKAKQAAKK